MSRSRWTSAGTRSCSTISTSGRGDIPDPDLNVKFAHKLDFYREMAAWYAERKPGPRARKGCAGSRWAISTWRRWSTTSGATSSSSRSSRTHRSRWNCSASSRPRSAGSTCRAGSCPKPRNSIPGGATATTTGGCPIAGERLDHILASPALAGAIRSHHIDVDLRDWEKASDHVPVSATFRGLGEPAMMQIIFNHPDRIRRGSARPLDRSGRNHPGLLAHRPHRSRGLGDRDLWRSGTRPLSCRPAGRFSSARSSAPSHCWRWSSSSAASSRDTGSTDPPGRPRIGQTPPTRHVERLVRENIAAGRREPVECRSQPLAPWRRWLRDRRSRDRYGSGPRSGRAGVPLPRSCGRHRRETGGRRAGCSRDGRQPCARTRRCRGPGKSSRRWS